MVNDVGGEHAEQRVQVAALGCLEELASELFALGPLGGGALSASDPAAAMRFLARAKIWRQFASDFPVVLATSG
ncbi:hypothetical protein [Streptomyces sp. NPDC050738]|uniref:hypothetical protein n=1 Tax=Streptomyces sp. NPDC050738 TaxID=3154744 RepID=UPI003433813D